MPIVMIFLLPSGWLATTKSSLDTPTRSLRDSKLDLAILYVSVLVASGLNSNAVTIRRTSQWQSVSTLMATLR